jgi:hypothetical protein
MKDENKTLWSLWECDGGARWSSVAPFHNSEGEICTFSGCSCGGKIRFIKSTDEPSEASEWFRRPCHPNHIKNTLRDAYDAFCDDKKGLCVELLNGLRNIIPPNEQCAKLFEQIKKGGTTHTYFLAAAIRSLP